MRMHRFDRPPTHSSPMPSITMLASYLFSGARGRALLGASLLVSLILFLSFRSSFGDTSASRSAAPSFHRPAGPTPGSQNALLPPLSHSSNPNSAERPLRDQQKPQKPDSGSGLAQSGKPLLQQLRSGDCEGFPDLSDVLVVMKTGATEAYDKLPIHFMSTLKCAKDVLIFSDMEMSMAGFHVRDVLADLDPEFVAGNPDFDIYRTLQDCYKNHQDPRDLKGMSGWNLDKYKFIPMMRQAWEYRKTAAWYVYIEADTFMQWDNLMQYLKNLDHRKTFYIGSPTYLDIQFAHGGTGYVVSNGAMAKAVGEHPEMVEKYSKEAQVFCCGDRMVAKVLLDAGIPLRGTWPMFNGEKALTLPFGPHQWCQPVISMHHLTAEEVSNMWNFHMTWRKKNKGPMLWRDVFDEFVKDNLRAQRDDWENLSDDAFFTKDPEMDFKGRKWDELTEREKASPESPERCKALCQSDPNCLQWQHNGKECRISFSVKLGKARRPDKQQRWVSGWYLDRIQTFRKVMEDCKKVDWKAR